jgi:glucosylceramidase
VRQVDGAVTFHAEYFALGHLSKALAPGARRLGSESTAGLGLEHVAFANPDGQVVVVAFNPAEQPTAFEVRAAAGTLTYTLPAGALATFVLPAP